MGKEWLYWAGGGGKSTTKGKPGRRGPVIEAAKAPPAGCMCAVFQLFDLHNFQIALHQQPSLNRGSSFLQLQDEPTVLKGVEAPRNSLDLKGTFMDAAASLSSITVKQDENLNIPMGIQIKTTSETRSPRASSSSSKAKTDDVFSECSSSPGTKTPNLVARLMGLDLLPESGSPSISSSRHSTSSSVANLHLNHQGQSQSQDQYSRSRQFLQSRSCSNHRSSFFDNDMSGALSLPETPRISSARRSDVDHHRLSLQINKENIGEDWEFPAFSAKKITRRREYNQDDGNRNAGHYARHIVKQVKERVSRKVGLDITNSSKSREQRRDDRVALLKPKKPSALLTRVGDESSPSKHSTPSCSPRLRFLDTKDKPTTTAVTKNQASNSPRLSPLSPSVENQSHVQQAKALTKFKPQVPSQEQQKSVQTCKNAGTERFNSRLRKPPQASDSIRNKKEDPFVRSTATNKANVSDKKCKKTPVSNELLNISVPTLLPLKKEPSLPAVTQLRDKQSSQASDAQPWKSSCRRSAQLSSCSSRSYKQREVTHKLLALQENIQYRSCNGTSTSVDEVEYQYIQRILKRTGIDKAMPVSLAKWFSPSHPLDPSIFHYIELFHPTINSTSSTASSQVSKLSQRCHRKLIFQLVDELLVGFLKPYIDLKPWGAPFSQCGQMYGSQLIETLCTKIGSFPSANCQVLEDIDALIDTDLCKSQLGISFACQEEGECLVLDIERYILDSLVHETVLVAFGFSMPRPC